MPLPVNSKGREVSVDPRCWDLALVFLGEFIDHGDVTDAHVADLAEEIQRCCESGSSEAEERRSVRQAAVVACINGKCDCRNAEACKFSRCKNCDNPINAKGKTVIDHCCEVEKLQVCPDCDGPLNERLVYGAL